MKKLLKEQKKDWNAISDKVWQDGVIVFDTNVLLNLYRYNEEARDELIGLMKSYKSRLWMPYQVGLEFLDNCEVVKNWLHKGYKDLTAQVDECKKNFFKFYDGHYSKHKHIHRDELEELFDKQLNPIKEKLSEWESAEPDYKKKDLVKEKILTLYDKRVGNDYNFDELLEIYAKGRIRYDNKIPPGYKDDTPDKREMGARHLYGDLIVWMQIMDYAKAENKDIIFVGDDLKEDWWEKEQGKLSQPRRELLDEFKYRTGREIVIHTQKGFIDASKKKLNENTMKEMERVMKENQQLQDLIRKMKESMASIMPRYDIQSLAEAKIPLYGEIQKLALNQNIVSLQESLKKAQDQLGTYSLISEQIAKMTMNGWKVTEVKKK